MKKNTIIFYLVLILLILFSGFFTLYFGTSYFSKEIKSEPIKLYFGGPNEEKIPTTISIQGQGNQESYGSNQRYFLNEITLEIIDPFEDSTSQFRFLMQNYTKKLNFWYLSDSGSEHVFNKTLFLEYQQKYSPDFVLTWNQIYNGYLPIWIEPFLSQPTLSVQIEPFLKKINSYTYKNSFYIDTNFETIFYGDENYPSSNIDKVNIKLYLDKRFEIVSPKEYSVKRKNDKINEISFSIIPEVPTTLEVIDPDKKKNSELISLIFGLVFASLFGLLLTELLRRLKK